MARMGAALAALHHGFDPERFMLPPEIEAGYRSWFARELRNRSAVLQVAESEGTVVGYAYGRLDGRDWNALLDAHGGFHDLWVDPAARRTGAGTLLAQAMMQRLTELGAPRVVLMAAARNESARALFESLGWRATMVEMTRESFPKS